MSNNQNFGGKSKSCTTFDVRVGITTTGEQCIMRPGTAKQRAFSFCSLQTQSLTSATGEWCILYLFSLAVSLVFICTYGFYIAGGADTRFAGRPFVGMRR
jgi:hypothetical protein